MFRSAALLAFLAPVAAAQSFAVPDGDATTGSCNVFPLGATGGSNQKYQTLVLAADLGASPGRITGLGFAACGTGVHHFETVQVRFDRTVATSLSATFAQNISANAVTVLSATGYDWNVTASSWSDIGLQDSFVHDGVSNLVVEITITGSEWSPVGGVGNGGFRAGGRQRVFASNWPAQPPAIGTLSSTLALKMQLDMGMARVSSHGRGCMGSNLLLPEIGFQGVPQPGQVVAFLLANALPSTLGAAAIGFDNRTPFPIDLTPLGMGTCLQYFAIDSVVFAVTDGVGAASSPPIVVPNTSSLVGVNAYAQWVCADAAATALGFTTSNYVRVQIGN